MLNSMTAFARADAKNDIGTFTWEIRSVNHRYLEPSFRMPETMRELESDLRDILRKYIARGKLECQLRVQFSALQNNSFQFDEVLTKQIVLAAEKIQKQTTNFAGINPLEVLQWPGVLQEAEIDNKAIHQTVLTLFQDTLKKLSDGRQREGAELKIFIEQKIESIANIVVLVRGKMPTILSAQRQKIFDRLAEATEALDPNRLEQEMVFIAQKSDVEEELDRLATHASEVKRILADNKEPVGRRLDFLMQELNREANTLSSKSIVTDTTQAAVELKVLIEQMREQVQNIE